MSQLWTPELLEAELARMSPEKAKEFLQLVEQLPPGFIDDSFPQQAEFILDPARLKVLLCTRRAGKSYGCGEYLLKTGYENPGCNLLFFGLTKDSAVAIIWKDVLKVLDKELRLGCKFYETDHHVVMPNGSVIYIGGVDVTEDERKKQYGRKYKLICIDESSSIRTDMKALIYGVLQPTVADELGTICMVGMPGDVTAGLFFEATEGQIPTNPGSWEWLDIQHGARWKGFRWTAFDNPHMRAEWTQEIEEKRRNNPDIDDTPLFKQHYLGEWFVDADQLVYKYAVRRNDLDVLPSSNDWRYLLGVDLGFEDDSAFVVDAWRPNDPNLYIVETRKRPGMDIVDVKDEIEALEVSYRFDRKVVDGANKQAVETIRRRYGINLTPSDKREKWEHIQLMNSDFRAGRIKLLPAAGPLAAEYSKLVKDPKSDVPREKEGLPNHCADASLYAWRYALNYRAKPPPPPPPPYGSKEWAEKDKERRFAAVAAAQRRHPGYG